MTRIYYELGRSGHGACLSCDLDALYTIGETLAPGEYWIRELATRPCGLPDFDALTMEADWGTLEVRGPGDWTLRALSGMQAGPGYLIV